MTIAAGFRCSDGVVLCADTEISAGASKFTQSKFHMSHHVACRPAFIYAGDRDYSIMAIELLVGGIMETESKGGADILNSIREKLIELHDSYYTRSTHDRSFELQAIGTVWVKDKRHLLLINGPTMSVVTGAECIGSGSYLGAYVIDSMLPQRASSIETAYVAAYLLFLAKRYVTFCGGNSQIIILNDKGGGWRPFPDDPMTSISIRDMESDFDSLQANLQGVLLGLANFENVKGADYEKVLAHFSAKAKTLREKRAKQIREAIEHYQDMQEREADQNRDED